ncbi:hypothetical protein CVT26_016200 [Gymnopilus dilepis]|uniref:Uncharacterized protein n=1 Tax=Gymnopilus dilepis TaxID=231916 RepID=A0A409XYY2_9AGAR|nr:hypothetical protein CVT26_016200 [Gymnopilus dilepis]
MKAASTTKIPSSNSRHPVGQHFRYADTSPPQQRPFLRPYERSQECCRRMRPHGDRGRFEAEQESMPAHAIGNSTLNSVVPTVDDEDDSPGTSNGFELPRQWKETLSHAAKGVMDNTHQEYIRLSEACASFLITNGLISDREQFLSKTPLPHSDEMIVAWIMNSCDTIGLDGKPAVGPRATTYAHAQKMRASMTHVFGRVLGIGSQPWKQASREGNRSVSEKVSTYMLSLRRRKAQAGETATSARAITPDILWLASTITTTSPQYWDMDNNMPRSRQDRTDIHRWVLRIKMEDLRIETNKITLTLDFRKTHQFGDIKPFVLHAFSPEEAHLCPVRALSDWLAVSGTTSGCIFRKMSKASGRAWANEEAVMNNFSRYSEIISLTSGSTPLLMLMELIHFDEAVANTLPRIAAGSFGAFVTGEAGVRSSPA